MSKPVARRTLAAGLVLFIPALLILTSPVRGAALHESLDLVAGALSHQAAALRHGSMWEIEVAERAARAARSALVTLLGDSGRAEADSSLALALKLLALCPGPLPAPEAAGLNVATLADLDDPFARRVAALLLCDAGDPAGAVAALAGDRSAWASLIRGVCHRKAGRPRAARLAFQRAIEGGGLLVRQLAFAAGTACTLEVAALGAERFATLLVELPLREDEKVAALRLLARHWEGVDHRAGALKAWRDLLESAGSEAEVEEAWDGLVRLSPAPTGADTLSHWAALTRVSGARATEVAERLIARPRGPAGEDELRLHLANQQRRAGAFTRARALVAPLVASSNPTRHGEGLLALARIERSTGDWGRMLAAYESAARAPAVRGTALFEAAWECHVGDSLAAARRLYARAMGAGAPRFESTFRAALAAFEAGDADSARTLFGRAVRLAQGAEARCRALFWARRSAPADSVDGGDLPDGDRYVDAPYAYIARAASSGLVGTDRILSAPGGGGGPTLEQTRGTPAPVTKAELPDWPEALGEAALAARLGERRAGILALRRAVRRDRDDPAELQRLGFGALQLGFPEIAIRAGFEIPDRLRDVQLRLRYPLAYLGEIRAALGAAGADVDPLLILALTRRESLFDPEARSAAGAMGLMQLIERTARIEAAQTTDLCPDSLDFSLSLFMPELNLRLGVQHLARLSRERDLLRAIAGYNAGLDVVDRWGDPAPDAWLWVETVPYRETREYLRAVIGAYLAYRDLYRASIDAEVGAW